MSIKLMSKTEALKKAKELKNHLAHINKEENTLEWNDNYLKQEDCFYSSQISRNPN